jgi:hypothetical protein
MKEEEKLGIVGGMRGERKYGYGKGGDVEFLENR